MRQAALRWRTKLPNVTYMAQTKRGKEREGDRQRITAVRAMNMLTTLARLNYHSDDDGDVGDDDHDAVSYDHTDDGDDKHENDEDSDGDDADDVGSDFGVDVADIRDTHNIASSQSSPSSSLSYFSLLWPPSSP